MGRGGSLNMPSGLRWRMVALLFASTVINYIDRQTLSVLSPHLKEEFHWTNSDFALLIISFRVAYTLGQAGCGRILDRLGTRRGLSLSVAWYSVIAMATSLVVGLKSLAAMRFLLGLGESANWPGATKAVSEWFPRKEKALAVAIFDSGSSIGAAVAPAMVIWLYQAFGGWRPAFLITGVLGFGWLLIWRKAYFRPQEHPRISQEELAMLETDQAGPSEEVSWFGLLKYRQTWGAIASKALTDPVWYLITDWFPLYLVSRGYRVEESLMAFWVPFLGADLGNYAGGVASSWLVARGWPVGRARKAVVVPGALGVLLLIPAAFAPSLMGIAFLFGGATFSYAAFSTMANTFPADCFTDGAVASVSGIGGAAAGAGTILSTYAVGSIADHVGFRPALIGASVIPLLAMALVLALVRNSRESGRGVVRTI